MLASQTRVYIHGRMVPAQRCTREIISMTIYLKAMFLGLRSLTICPILIVLYFPGGTRHSVGRNFNIKSRIPIEARFLNTMQNV
jgi:hypothetical protein